MPWTASVCLLAVNFELLEASFLQQVAIPAMVSKFSSQRAGTDLQWGTRAYAPCQAKVCGISSGGTCVLGCPDFSHGRGIRLHATFHLLSHQLLYIEFCMLLQTRGNHCLTKLFAGDKGVSGLIFRHALHNLWHNLQRDSMPLLH